MNIKAPTKTVLSEVDKIRQKIASLLSAVLFGGFLWILFKKVNIVVLVNLKWWHFVLLLGVLFFVIDTMVSKGVGARKPLDRGKDRLSAMKQDASKHVSERSEAVLNEIKRKLADGE